MCGDVVLWSRVLSVYDEVSVTFVFARSVLMKHCHVVLVRHADVPPLQRVVLMLSIAFKLGRSLDWITCCGLHLSRAYTLHHVLASLADSTNKSKSTYISLLALHRPV